MIPSRLVVRCASLINETGVEPLGVDLVNRVREAVGCDVPVGLFEQPGDLGGSGDSAHAVR